MLHDAERELIRCICCTSTPAVFRVASAPVLMGEKMMTVMTVMMQAGKRQCLQLLSSYWGWQSTCDRLKYISHLSHLINTPIYSCSCFFVSSPRVPPTDFLPSLSLSSHISWCIICTIASLCKWRKRGDNFNLTETLCVQNQLTLVPDCCYPDVLSSMST